MFWNTETGIHVRVSHRWPTSFRAFKGMIKCKVLLISPPFVSRFISRFPLSFFSPLPFLFPSISSYQFSRETRAIFHAITPTIFLTNRSENLTNRIERGDQTPFVLSFIPEEQVSQMSTQRLNFHSPIFHVCRKEQMPPKKKKKKKRKKKRKRKEAEIITRMYGLYGVPTYKHVINIEMEFANFPGPRGSHAGLQRASEIIFLQLAGSSLWKADPFSLAHARHTVSHISRSKLSVFSGKSSQITHSSL